MEDNDHKVGRPLASFLLSLYKIINDSSESGGICTWTSSGTSFCILNIETFSSDVLPKYFKHSNFSSLSRQLCFYNFRKIAKSSAGGSKSVEYSHPYFQRGRADLLPFIVRKTNATATAQLEEREVHLREQFGDPTHIPAEVATEFALSLAGTNAVSMAQLLEKSSPERRMSPSRLSPSISAPDTAQSLGMRPRAYSEQYQAQQSSSQPSLRKSHPRRRSSTRQPTLAEADDSMCSTGLDLPQLSLGLSLCDARSGVRAGRRGSQHDRDTSGAATIGDECGSGASSIDSSRSGSISRGGDNSRAPSSNTSAVTALTNSSDGGIFSYAHRAESSSSSSSTSFSDARWVAPSFKREPLRTSAAASHGGTIDATSRADSSAQLSWSDSRLPRWQGHQQPTRSQSSCYSAQPTLSQSSSFHSCSAPGLAPASHTGMRGVSSQTQTQTASRRSPSRIHFSDERSHELSSIPNNHAEPTTSAAADTARVATAGVQAAAAAAAAESTTGPVGSRHLAEAATHDLLVILSTLRRVAQTNPTMLSRLQCDPTTLLSCTEGAAPLLGDATCKSDGRVLPCATTNTNGAARAPAAGATAASLEPTTKRMKFNECPADGDDATRTRRPKDAPGDAASPAESAHTRSSVSSAASGEPPSLTTGSSESSSAKGFATWPSATPNSTPAVDSLARSHVLLFAAHHSGGGGGGSGGGDATDRSSVDALLALQSPLVHGGRGLPDQQQQQQQLQQSQQQRPTCTTTTSLRIFSNGGGGGGLSGMTEQSSDASPGLSSAYERHNGGASSSGSSLSVCFPELGPLPSVARSGSYSVRSTGLTTTRSDGPSLSEMLMSTAGQPALSGLSFFSPAHATEHHVHWTTTMEQEVAAVSRVAPHEQPTTEQAMSGPVGQ